MYHLSSLVSQLKKKEQAVVVANGHAVWLVWQDSLSDAVSQTLSSYGGWILAEEKEQALWFFPGKEVLKGLARIYGWSQINPLVIFIEVFPAKLLVAYDFSVDMAVDPALVKQSVPVPKELDILVAPQVDVETRRVPGLHFDQVQRADLAGGSWNTFKVDTGMDYSTYLAWFLLIKPVGNARARDFVDGWRMYSSRLKKLFDQLKIKYLYTEETEVVLYCKTYQGLQTLCLELMDILSGKEEEVKPWPCIYVGLEKEHHHFGKGLPKKLGIPWDFLESDFIHFPLKTVFQLGRSFVPMGRLSPFKGKSNLDSLVKMHRSQEGQEGGVGNLKVFLPHHALDGDNPPCFYCGLRNHRPAECPTRVLRNLNSGVHDDLAELDLDQIRQALDAIDQKLGEEGVEGVKDCLQGNKDPHSVVMAAFLEINVPSQIRTMRLVWRSKGKDWPRGLKEVGGQEEDSAWAALHRFRNGDPAGALDKLDTFIQSSPRHYKAKTLMGFISLEKGHPRNALASWKEAEEFCFTSLHKSYHIYLRARLHETQLEYDEAMRLYRDAVKHSPAMLEARYRQGACLVKTGFAEQALGIFLDLVKEDPRYMNLILIDPELERGHLHLMTGLWKPWMGAQKSAQLCLKDSDGLSKTVEQWFSEDHPAHDGFKERIASMLKHKDKENYVHLVHVARASSGLNADIQKRVEKDIKELHLDCREMYAELEEIQKEAGWFPFSRYLSGFNKDFNACIRDLNAIGRLNLYHPDSFKKGHGAMARAASALERLREHLKSLVFIRDSTLFALLFGKNFLWIELTCLVLSIAIVPLLTMWGLKTGQPWGQALSEQKWLIHKVVIIVASICALGGAAIWTTMRFDKKRKKYLEDHSR
ncbi:tetratricopeptide repeat protein [Desulfoplanes sp.]